MALDEETMLTLMGTLDAGTSMFGALSPGVRARIYAVVADPADETWDNARCVLVSGEPLRTLWQAVIAHTDYNVTSKPDGPWPVIPTREQILTALIAELGSGPRECAHAIPR